MKTIYPRCGEHYEIPNQDISQEAARIMGRRTSPAKSATSRANGKKGGRPKKQLNQGTVSPQK